MFWKQFVNSLKHVMSSYVDWRHDARLQLEFAKFDGFQLVQFYDDFFKSIGLRWYWSHFGFLDWNEKKIKIDESTQQFCASRVDHNNKKQNWKPEFKGYWVVLGCIYASIHS